MALDVQALRADTPGCQQVVHLDSASQALLAQPIIDSMLRRLEAESRLGEDYLQSSRSIARESVAQLIGAEGEQIALTPNGSFGWIQAFLSVHMPPGGVILASKQEFQTAYAAIVRTCSERQLRLRIVPNDETGALSLPALANMLDSEVTLLCVTHMPANAGTVNPVKAIGELAMAAHIPWILDACQSLGQVPLNVHELSCSYLVATGRKYLRAPQGTGFLYVSPEADNSLTPQYVDYGGLRTNSHGAIEYKMSARRYEMYSLSETALEGLAAAAHYASAIDMPATWSHIRHLVARLVSELAELPISAYNSGSACRSGIVSIGTGQIDARVLRKELFRRGFIVGLARNSSTPLDDSQPNTDQLRISIHYYNTEQEILSLRDALSDILKTS